MGAGLFFLLFLIIGYCAVSAAFSALPQVPVITRLFAGLPPPSGRAGALLADPLLGLFIALTIAVLLWTLYRWVEWTQEAYVVTDDRLIKQHRDWTPLGWTYVTREMLVRQIRDVDVHQDRLLWKMLRCGTLEIHTLSEPETGQMKRPDPYQNPRKPHGIDLFPGVEWWFCVPKPVLLQREILEVNTAIERSQHLVDS